MEARFIAAIDQGTTGTRCMLFDRAGHVVASAYEEHRQIYPQPGWVEHDAWEIWYKTKKVIRAALDILRTEPNEIAAIGITNQRETTVVWNPHTGEPYYNAIVWQDTRTRDGCERLIADGAEEKIRAATGLPLATYFSATKLQWLLKNVAGLREQVEQGRAVFGNIDAWLIWNLTGAHVTDFTNASRTLLWNLRTREWDDELLARFQIPRALLPQLRASSDPKFYGYTRAAGPFGAEIPVCGDLGDQQAALFGQTCFDAGEAKNTYGTGNFILLNTGDEIIKSKSGSLTTCAYSIESHTTNYALEGSVAVTGAAVQWLRDNLGIIANAAESEALAQTVDDTGGVYFVPAFSGLYAPHWDMTARGAIVGLSRYSTKAHLIRATLEAICYQTREALEAMEQDADTKLTWLKVDGGATKNNLLMQMQADILGIPVVRPVVNETTALGAAYAAGLAVGFWEDLEALRANWQLDRVFEPSWDKARREEGYANWRRAVERARGWLQSSDHR